MCATDMHKRHSSTRQLLLCVFKDTSLLEAPFVTGSAVTGKHTIVEQTN